MLTALSHVVNRFLLLKLYHQQPKGKYVLYIPLSSLRHDSIHVSCIVLHFMCPITNEVMEDPVKAMDGFTYERSAMTT